MRGKSIHFILLVLALVFIPAINARAIDRNDPDLIGYWTFNEGSGTVAADQSANGYNGTLEGNVTWTDGVYGGALHFVGGMAYTILKGQTEKIPALIDLNVPDILGFMGHVSLKIGFYTCLILIVLAGLDYIFQRWQHERDLRMSKQEVKDEHKQREGDPLVRSRIRAAQREMAMRRMMADIPKATVVITNPTHLAIALKFERSMQAPMVVAKGAGHVAERIRNIAEQHDIPIIEQKPLARALYKKVEIGHYIPAELYHAVAEILAYVYRLKGLQHAAA